MSNAATLLRCVLVLLLVAASGPRPSAQLGAFQGLLGTVTSLVDPLPTLDPIAKVDPLAQQRLLDVTGSSRVIIRAVDNASPGSLTGIIQDAGGTVLRTFSLINAQVVEMPNA